jgi:hypothetical protein
VGFDAIWLKLASLALKCQSDSKNPLKRVAAWARNRVAAEPVEAGTARLSQAQPPFTFSKIELRRLLVYNEAEIAN